MAASCKSYVCVACATKLYESWASLGGDRLHYHYEYQVKHQVPHRQTCRTHPFVTETSVSRKFIGRHPEPQRESTPASIQVNGIWNKADPNPWSPPISGLPFCRFSVVSDLEDAYFGVTSGENGMTFLNGLRSPGPDLSSGIASQNQRNPDLDNTLAQSLIW